MLHEKSTKYPTRKLKKDYLMSYYLDNKYKSKRSTYHESEVILVDFEINKNVKKCENVSK